MFRLYWPTASHIACECVGVIFFFFKKVFPASESLQILSAFAMHSATEDVGLNRLTTGLPMFLHAGVLTFLFLVEITSVKLCGVCLFIPWNIQAAGGGLVKAGCCTTSSLPFPGNEPFSCFISDATLSRSIMFDLSEGNKFRGPTATLDDAAPDVVS